MFHLTKAALRHLKARADVVCPDDILWKHRRDDDRDIYFVSNQKYEERTESISFRVGDRTPALWRPDSGTIEAVPFEVQDGRTVISMHFDPAGSVFVVFDKTARKLDAPQGALEKVADVTGPWQVTFPSQQLTFDTLTSWTDHADPAIKYYSGTATYRTEFTLAEVRETTILDLGTLHEMAKVRVNGNEVATLWKPPYRVDISNAVKAGENTLEVDVVNTWLNRVIGDAQPGVTTPETFTTTKNWKADTPLQPAGLLGPVTLQGVDR